MQGSLCTGGQDFHWKLLSLYIDNKLFFAGGRTVTRAIGQKRQLSFQRFKCQEEKDKYHFFLYLLCVENLR